jgi:class 3 adenylate cyclase/tetratricopeptide (TPR) repeat protein
MRCPSCGQENPEGFRFCGNCAAPLTEAPARREVRKTVTVVFCDLTGSTALGDTTDPEALRATMRAYYEEMRTILERHGGTVEKFIGDAVMAVFGVPVAHEDDALRAVRAAWEMRTAVPALGLQGRIGVNTGEIVTGEGDTLVTGDAVNVAARLEQAAEPGQVLIGGETRRLVRDAIQVSPVEVTAKGKPEPVEAFRLDEVDLEAASIARRLDTPLVGRAFELEQLRGAFDRTVRERRCHLFTLLGAAGVGKSRLVAEFLRDVDADIVSGRCLDYGEGITFWPVVSVLKQLGPRADDTLARVVGGATLPNEIFAAVRLFLESLAADRPLIVVFEDIHWGEPTFLDLIDHVADLSRGAPLLILCVARPELLDKRPGWAGGKLNATTILLAPLGPDECTELIAVHGGVEPELQIRILAAADGNPLFVEEMVALAREDGGVGVPSTVQALLQARIDQLGGEERVVIERGAVEGEVFHRSAVLELTRTSDVEPQLVGLVRKELIHPAPATFTGDQAYRFRHLLIRDAAYGALPKETRAELHERFADWLELHAHDLIELDEIAGYHLEQAARYLRELGRSSTELERRAGHRLADAGRRAGNRSDAPAAMNLLGRAVALLPENDPVRVGAYLDRLMLLMSTEEADERIRMIEALEASDDPALRMHGRLARLELRLWSDPTDASSDVHPATQEAIHVFEVADDQRGLAYAWHLRAHDAWLGSRARDTFDAVEESLRHGSRVDAIALRGIRDVIRFGPIVHGPFTTEEAMRLHEGLPEGVQLVLQSHVAFKEGRFADSLALLERTVENTREWGLPAMTVPPKTAQADVLDAAGRYAESIALWEEAAAALRTFGQTSLLSTVLCQEAVAHYHAGHLDDAERLAIEGEELGAPEDVVNFAWGRGIRARIAADRGDRRSAEELARSALEYAYLTDFPRVRGDAHETLGYVLRAAGRTDEARPEYVHALEIWERYDWLFNAERARNLLVEL